MIVRRLPESSELYHHGVEGQRWGIRRYQNEDGTLTPLGEKRYGTVANFEKAQKKKKNFVAGVAAGAAVGAAGAYAASKGLIDDKTLARASTVAVAVTVVNQIAKHNSQPLKSSKNVESGKQHTDDVLKKIENKDISEVSKSNNSKKTTEKSSKKTNESKLSVKDIDDEEIIDLYIDEPSFRKEYNISDQQYKKFKKSGNYTDVGW